MPSPSREKQGLGDGRRQRRRVATHTPWNNAMSHRTGVPPRPGNPWAHPVRAGDGGPGERGCTVGAEALQGLFAGPCAPKKSIPGEARLQYFWWKARGGKLRLASCQAWKMFPSSHGKRESQHEKLPLTEFRGQAPCQCFNLHAFSHSEHRSEG